jgi:hypothetical protein
VKHALKDVLDTVAEAGSLKVFSSALKAAGPVEMLTAADASVAMFPSQASNE